jgi:predicted porin
MNKNIKLAVAGAVLALSATAANAGIIIPAGDWTLDVSGNVNSYTNYTRTSGENLAIQGGLAGANVTGTRTANTMSTGLLPNFLSVAGSTRQNDLDVTFLISINPGSFAPAAANGGSSTEHRQAFLTFGDKSWGSIKVGKDLGIYASDAILNDMTLLGVGSGSGSFASNASTTSLGRIGSGFQYADWKTQIAYTTPNFSGFQATVGLTQAWDLRTSNTTAVVNSLAGNGSRGGSSSAYEGKASYSFSANDVTGKIWVSGLAQRVERATGNERDAWSADIGANVNVAGLGLTGYYYTGEGTGTTFMFQDGYSTAGKKRDVDGGYVQATYVLPTKTKVGVSWGQSNLDRVGGETVSNLIKTNEMSTVGAYHPLTKHLNLVAEYNHVESEAQDNSKGKTKAVSLGAILFF